MTDLPQGEEPTGDKLDIEDQKTARRRALMRKLAAGAFALPLAMTLLTTKAAASS